jgi:hypothetical protein
MPRVVPTDVKEFIDRSVPVDSTGSIYEFNVGPIETVINLVENIPNELLLLDSKSFTAFSAALSQLKSAVRTFRNEQSRHNYIQPTSLGLMTAYGNLTPLAVISRELTKCPDNVPRSDLPDLAFIEDFQLRDTLRKDMASAAAALGHDEWKTATVLAGSVIEALLLWALESKRGEISAAIAALDASGDFKTVRKPDANELDWWNLSQYIMVAAHLDVIGDKTATVVDQTRAFRNLIHPGKVKRTQQTCSRGTAYTAYAALQLTIEDLVRQHP